MLEVTTAPPDHCVKVPPRCAVQCSMTTNSATRWASVGNTENARYLTDFSFVTVAFPLTISA